MGPGTTWAVDLTQPTYVDGAPAWVLAALVLGGGAFLLGWLLRLRAGLVARATREKTLAAGTEALVEGSTLGVRGKVAPVDDQPGAPVHVRIRQKAKNRTSKNNKWYTWEEVPPRTIQARPFLLEREGGEPVRVEPAADVFVIDDLATVPDPTYATRRSRVSEVVVGEELCAYGTVVLAPSAAGRAHAGSYRGGKGWSLVVPRGERMVLASSSLDHRYEPRISFLGRWAAACTVVWLVVNFVVVAPFVSATLVGTREMSRLVDTKTWTTTSKGNITVHYGVRVLTDDGTLFDADVGREAYEACKAAKALDPGVRVPTVRAFGWAWATYVGAPAMSIPGAVIALAIAGVLAIVGAPLYDKRLAWYDRPSLSEEGGAGHLFD